MKAIGAKPWFILSMFLSDAVLIGLIGATLGISAGIGLAYLLAASGASGGGQYVAPIFLPDDLIRVWLLSLTVSLVAALFPAWKASRLSPLVAMRQTNRQLRSYRPEKLLVASRPSHGR